MITYEYECSVCDHKFEIEQSINDDSLSECPKCRVASLKRLISNENGFVLKGNNWEKDGYSGNK